MAEYDVIQNLELWCKKQKIEPHPGLKIAEFGNSGRGILACEKIQKNSLLVRVPKHAIITTKTVLDCPVVGKCVQSQLKSFIDVPIQILCVFLLKHKSMQKDSPWWIYLEYLPKGFQTTAVHWKEDTINLMHNKQKIAKIHRKQEKTKNLYQNLLSFFENNSSLFSPQSDYSFDVFLWAYSSVMTRSVYVDVNNELDPRLSAWHKNNYGLTPWLDAFNHDCNTEVRAYYTPPTESYELYTLQDWEPGNQVFIAYGNHSNYILLIEYGFILDHNTTNDSFLFESEIYEKAISEDKLNFLGMNGLLPGRGRKKSYYATRDVENPLSWNYVTALRVILATTEEENRLQDVLSEIPLSKENEKRVWQFIVQEFQKFFSQYQTSVEEDENLIASTKDYLTQCVIKVRKTDKEIIQNVIRCAKYRLNNII